MWGSVRLCRSCQGCMCQLLDLLAVGRYIPWERHQRREQTTVLFFFVTLFWSSGASTGTTGGNLQSSGRRIGFPSARATARACLLFRNLGAQVQRPEGAASERQALESGQRVTLSCLETLLSLWSFCSYSGAKSSAPKSLWAHRPPSV